MGRFDTQQAQVEALRGEESPEELKKTIADESATLVNAVDSGEKLLEEAAGQFKTPEARTYIKEAGGEVKSILIQIAVTGQDILKDEGKLKSGIGSIESFIDDLQNALKEEKALIEEYRKYEEGKKKAEAFASKTKESKVVHTELLNYERTLGPLKEQGKDPTTVANLEQSILQHRDWLTEDAHKLSGMHKGIRTSEGAGQEGTILYSTHSAIFDHYKKVYTTKFAPAEKDYLTIQKDLETIKEEQGGEVYEQFEAVQSSLDAYSSKFAEYESKMQVYQSRYEWRKVPQEEKEAFLSMEGGLFGMYLSSKGLLQGIRSSEYVSRNSSTSVGMESANALRDVESKIKNIETYKTFREVQQKKFGNSINIEIGEDGYATIIIDEEGIKKRAKRIGEAIIIDGEEVEESVEEVEREITMTLETRIEEAKAKAEEETEDMEKAIREKMGKGNMEAVEKQFGEKGKKYFEGIRLLQVPNFKGAKRAFQEYLAQEFSDEEKELHSECIATAQEQVKVSETSAQYYIALESLDSEPDITYNLLNKYIQSVETLPKEEQSLHLDQVANAKEVIRSIGISQLKIFDELLEDVSDVRGSKTGGNIVTGLVKFHRLSLSEKVEYDILSVGISELRQQMATKGNILDADGQPVSIYKAIEELRARAKAKRATVMEETNEYGKEDSIADEIAGLHDAINSKDPEKKKQAFIAFAKRARGEMKLGVARKYLDRALEDLYEEYDKGGRSKYGESKREVKGDLLKDPQALADIQGKAKQLYEKMKADNSLLGLSLEQIEKRLLDQRVDSVYRARIRRNMIVTDKLTESDEALDLYEDWFPHKKPKWWNPFSWGAAEMEQNQIGMVRFALETAATIPIGYAAGAVGTKVGAMVVRILGRGGMSAATCAAIETGGLTALRAVLSKGGSKALLGYAAAGISSVSAEGAVFFTGGTFQSALFHYEQTMQQIREGGYLGDGKQLGSSIALAGVYRIIGRIGGRILGENPGLKRIIMQEIASGGAGMGVEAGFLGIEGQEGQITSHWAFKQIMGNAFQSGFAHAGRTSVERSAKRFERKMERVGADIEEGAKVIREMQEGEAGLDFVGKVKARAIAEDFKTKAEEARKRGDPDVAARYEEASQSIGRRRMWAPRRTYIPRIKRGPIVLRRTVQEMLDRAFGKAKPGTKPDRVTVKEDGGALKVPELENPSAIESVEVRKDGALLVNGKVTPGFSVEGFNALPKPVQDRIVALHPEMGELAKRARECAEAREKFAKTRGNPIAEVQRDADIQKGEFPLLGEQIRSHLLTPEGVIVLREFLKNPDLKLDWKYTRADLEQKVKAAERYFKDVDAISTISTTQRPEVLGEHLRRVMEDIKAGKPIDNKDTVAKLFERLNEYAPGKMEALAKSDIEALVKSDCFKAIFKNRTKVLEGLRGRVLEVYMGRDLGEGGQGKTKAAAYLNLDGEYVIGALKTPSEEGKRLFHLEVAGAQMLGAFDHPHIIKPLVVGETFVLYETGSGARDMLKLERHAEFRDYFRHLGEATDGVIALHDGGYAHGDLKQENILTYLVTGEDGIDRRVTKLIDFQVIPFSSAYGQNPILRTPGYNLSPAQRRATADFLHSRGTRGVEAIAWTERAQDARAMGQIYMDSLWVFAMQGKIPRLSRHDQRLVREYSAKVREKAEKGKAVPKVPTSIANPAMRQYLAVLRESFDPTRSGDPAYMRRFREASRTLGYSLEEGS